MASPSTPPSLRLCWREIDVMLATLPYLLILCLAQGKIFVPDAQDRLGHHRLSSYQTINYYEKPKKTIRLYADAPYDVPASFGAYIFIAGRSDIVFEYSNAGVVKMFESRWGDHSLRPVWQILYAENNDIATTGVANLIGLDPAALPTGTIRRNLTARHALAAYWSGFLMKSPRIDFYNRDGKRLGGSDVSDWLSSFPTTLIEQHWLARHRSFHKRGAHVLGSARKRRLN